MTRRHVLLCLALAALTPLAVAPVASAERASASATAKKKVKRPTITRVTPMRLRVGTTVTIRGRNFNARRTRNTLIFKAPNGRSAFAKPIRASRTKLVVRVPTAVGRLLGQKSTRFRLRVLAARKFGAFTTKRLSPVVVPSSVAGRVPGGPKAPAATACGDDGDLLPASLEIQIKTDPCLRDTDGDGMEDGWEYYAAKDLNIKAVPYPGTRPFPNALDPSDGSNGAGYSAIDFDGDGLTTYEEHRAWVHTGKSFNAAATGGADLLSPLGYSDGTKFSRATSTPGVPAWRSSSYGLSNPTQPFPATYDLHGDGAWRDDERDADGDGLANWLESAHGPSNNGWWKSYFASRNNFDPAVNPWDGDAQCGPIRPGHFDERPFVNLSLTDSDVDGDRLLDGEDDQDSDDFDNITELYEVSKDLDGNGNPAFCLWGPGAMPSIAFAGSDYPVNAMNPCVPNLSPRTCPDRIPF